MFTKIIGVIIVTTNLQDHDMKSTAYKMVFHSTIDRSYLHKSYMGFVRPNYLR